MGAEFAGATQLRGGRPRTQTWGSDSSVCGLWGHVSSVIYDVTRKIGTTFREEDREAQGG